ncbi:MAG: hypothetical protein ACRD0K_20030 [Egibacteraceae bacterium]
MRSADLPVAARLLAAADVFAARHIAVPAPPRADPASRRQTARWRSRHRPVDPRSTCCDSWRAADATSFPQQPTFNRYQGPGGCHARAGNRDETTVGEPGFACQCAKAGKVATRRTTGT